MLDLAEAGEIPADWLGEYEAPLPGTPEIVEAFWELSSDRQIGFGVGPIPAGSIARYAEMFGYDLDEQEQLRRLIRAMDNAYLKSKAEQQKASQS